jgi:hypothetical protein
MGVVLLAAGLTDEGRNAHATIMPEPRTTTVQLNPLRRGPSRVRLVQIVVDVMTTIEAAGEGVPRLGGQS